MSWSNKALKFAPAISALIVIATLTACQIRPLYGTSDMSETLSSILVSDPQDEYTQIVRNELVFLLARGAGDPSSPRYKLNLAVTKSKTDVLLKSTSDRAKSGRLTLTANYTLSTSTGEKVLSRRRSVTALADYSAQEFSKIRALRDATHRAGRELAEFIRADIAAALARKAP
jgi:LPS-assembly lipoprotein